MSVDLLPAGRKAAVEGDVEGVERRLPADRPAALPGAGRVETHDGHVDALERGGLVGEVPAGLDRPADARVDRLDRVRNRYERPRRRRSRRSHLRWWSGVWSVYGATVRDRGAGSEAGWAGRCCTLG